jgi:serine protease AprX
VSQHDPGSVQPADAGGSSPGPPDSSGRAQVPRQAIADPLADSEARKRIGLDERPDVPQPVIVELNIANEAGMDAVRSQFEKMLRDVCGEATAPPVHIAGALDRCKLSVKDAERIVELDSQREPRQRLIHRIWPDFPVRPLTR